MHFKKFGSAILVAAAIGCGSVKAQSLTVGLSADVTSVDPHFHLLVTNQQMAEHMFDRLVHRENTMRLVPGLALSWKPVNDTTWEFKLRPNVKFHDGSVLTAEDVVFSIERVPQIKDSPGPLTAYTRAISKMEIVDPLTIRFSTAAVYPLLPNDLSIIPIVSKKAATGASTAEFNSGKAAIGTGPFKYAKFTRGDRVELQRNNDYWGPKPAWEKVTFRIITNDAARVAALLAKDVDIIDATPVSDIEKLKSNPQVNVTVKAGTRLIYFAPNVGKDSMPWMVDPSGKVLETNPLKDARVREAISRLIDRDAIRQRVMEGASMPTNQLVANGMPGHSAKLTPPPVDIAAAKKLLADAGYKDGFGITIHAPNNRYVQDDQITQAVAAMLGRAGVRAKVETLPAASYFPRANKSEFALFMLGWAPDSGDASSPLRALFASKNPDKGWGAFNGGGYSNPQLDKLLEQALATIDADKRDAILQQAVEVVVKDFGLIPLHHQANVWSMRQGIAYAGRPDERTYAHEISLKTP